MRRYADHIQDPDYRARLDVYLVTQPCLDCEGTRLRPESRAVTVAGQNIVALSRLSLEALADWLKALPAALTQEEVRLADAVLADLNERTERLLQAGAGYLTLERTSPSLSAGEAQRLRLAALVGSDLTGLLYIFDEPTIGLHQRDTRRLIQMLCHLRDLGNTVLVVEHDLEVARAADTLIDIGPGAGKYGGQVVAVGTPDEVSKHPVLNHRRIPGWPRAGGHTRATPAARRQRIDDHRRTPAQLEESHIGAAAGAVCGCERCIRFGEELAGLRHPGAGRAYAFLRRGGSSGRTRRHSRLGGVG